MNAEAYLQRIYEARRALDRGGPPGDKIVTVEEIHEEIRDLAPRVVECPGCHQPRDVNYALIDERGGPLDRPEHRIQEHNMPPIPQISSDQRRCAYVHQRCWGSRALVGYWKAIER